MLKSLTLVHSKERKMLIVTATLYSSTSSCGHASPSKRLVDDNTLQIYLGQRI